MNKKIEELILRSLTMVPGIVGLASIDFDKSNRSLPEEKWLEGIEATEDNKGLSLSIAVIIEHNINVNVVIKEIDNAVRMIISKQGIQVNNIRTYIRGVR